MSWSVPCARHQAGDWLCGGDHERAHGSVGELAIYCDRIKCRCGEPKAMGKWMGVGHSPEWWSGKAPKDDDICVWP